jgi:signal transduction histidine kinase/ActR/RegA family two-component response regulator
MNTDDPPRTPAPAGWTRALDHLSFRVKFLVIGLLLAAPLLVSASWVSATARAKAQQAQERVQAVALMRTLADVLAATAEHRSLSARVLAGSEGLSAELVQRQQSFRALASTADDALGAAAHLVPGAARLPLRAEVDALVQLPHALEPDRNFERHNEFADRLLAISEALELRMLSGLEQDAAMMATAYAAVFARLPLLAEQLSRQKGYGSWLLTQQTYTPAEINRYGLVAGHARQSLRRFSADQATLDTLDRYLGPAAGRAGVRDPLAQADVFVERSLAAVLSFTRSDDAAAQHHSEGATALAGLARISQALSLRLAQQADEQQAAAAFELRVAVAALAGALLLIGALYLGFERSTVGRLQALKRASEGLAAGRFGAPITVGGSDEIAVLGRALEHLRGQLQQAVAENARAMATQQAEAARTAWLARWSHDLRTPLTAVLGYTQLLLAGSERAAEREPLQRIDGAARHLLQLVDELLQVSTTQAASLEDLPLHSEPLDMAARVRDAVALLEPSARGQRLHIELDAPPSLPAAVGDRARLLQVLTNLLSNAVKFSPAGGTVRVRVRADALSVGITVEDEGPGLSRVALARVFRPLERLDAAERGIPGTGLGLAIAQRLAERMGGTLTAQSQPGQGSRFTVTLPRWQGAMTAPRAARTGAAEGLRGRVALVEDNEVNAGLMQALLAPHPGVQLQVYADSASALQDAQPGRFDLWVIDREVGTHDGLELLAQLRERAGPLKAVMYSADSRPATREAALRAGFREYWLKPMTFDALLAGLHRQLQADAADDAAWRQPVADGDRRAVDPH